MTLTVKNTETNDTETINDVCGVWNEGRTIEFVEDGESVFLHLEEWEEIING